MRFNLLSKRFILTLGATAACLLGLAMATLTPANAGTNPANQLLAGSRTVSGTVMDPDGKPAANVPVRLMRFVPDPGPTRKQPGGSPTGDSVVGAPEARPLQKGGGAAQNVAQAMTDSQGKFSFKNIEEGEYVIVAGTPKAAGKERVSVGKDNDPAPVTIKLKKATT